jgi:hypothetical protein
MLAPPIDSLDLAYETGVHLGDGCLQQFPRYNYRYVVSGSRQNEQEYYRQVLAPMLFNLYGLVPSIVESRGSICLYIYSKELLQFKHDVMQLPVGPKSQLERLPSYVRSAKDEWVGRFLRGIYDTDGSVKLRRTCGRSYPRISFAQAVEGIVNDVSDLIRDRFSISTTCYSNATLDRRSGKRTTRWYMDINGVDNFTLFMRFIGTQNPHVMERVRAQIGHPNLES